MTIFSSVSMNTFVSNHSFGCLPACHCTTIWCRIKMSSTSVSSSLILIGPTQNEPPIEATQLFPSLLAGQSVARGQCCCILSWVLDGWLASCFIFWYAFGNLLTQRVVGKGKSVIIVAFYLCRIFLFVCDDYPLH